MSAGQIIGGIVGAVVGFFAGGNVYQGAVIGAQLGAAVGGMIDPPRGPHIIGPRLTDLTTQTSTYGAVIPRVYGTVPIVGNVFWLENNRLKEIENTQSQGKGGGAPETTTFTYSATFAVGLCEGPIAGVRRIWIGANLFYDAGASDLSSIIASNASTPLFKIYTGSDTQLPDARMQSTLGVANTPAYRGLAYIVFYDLPMKDYQNSLVGAQVKVEVMKSATTLGLRTINDVANIGVQFATNSIGGVGHPAIVFADGVMRVATLSDALIRLFDINGKFIGADGNGAEVFPSGAGGAYVTSYPVGIVGGMPLRVQYINQPIGSKIILPVGTQDASNDPLGIGGYDISSVLPAGEFVGGVSISPDGANLIIYTAPSDASPGASIVNKWYLLSFNGTASLIRSGTISPSVAIYSFEFGNSTTYNFECSALDTDLRTIWACAGGGGTLTQYVIGDDNVLRSGGVLGSVIGDSPFPYPTIYAKNGVAYVIAGKRLTVFTAASLLTSTPPALSSIVSAECLKSNLLSSSDIDVTALTSAVRGYTISSIAAIRGGFDPLIGAWPFDVIQSGYKIKFTPRGGSSVVTIPVAKLDARSISGQPGVQITNAREMDSVLPSKVALKFFDSDREYNTGEQYAERLNTQSVNVTAMDLAIVLTADEAAQKAEILLYLYWLERYDVSFKLPPEYDYLEPADVVTVTTSDATYQLRLTQINYTSDGRLECQAKYNNAAVYTSTASGGVGASTGQTLTLAGPSQYELLDIPLLKDVFDTAGFPVAMAGYLSGWPGGILMRSDDAGQTWAQVQGFLKPGATMGYASNSLSVHSGLLIDKAGSLQMMVNHALSSVTELQMLNGANHFAYGLDGRWEIIAAQNCVLQSDGSYILTDLLRGRFGSEWATGLHAANDHLVLLNTASLQFVASNINVIGMARTYRGITTGKTIDSDSNRTMTYNGINLKCLSPVYLNGNRNPSTNDWTLTWIRRTRKGGELRDLVDVPLSEASESYSLDIFADGTYATVKRTLAATTPTVAYTSAQQVSDFGSNQPTLYIKIYQISATTGRGYPLTASITR